MNVSSVKNLNGETFSAVQDADLTTVVQTNSSNWNDISAYQNASGTYLTAINIPESADWEDTTDVVQTNSAAWGAGSTPTYDYTDNNLISAIDTSGLYATSAGTSNALKNGGRLGYDVYAITGAGTNSMTLMILNPQTTPFGNTSGIYGPLYYAQGACMTYGSSAGNTQYFGGFVKGNEWYVSNATAGQALRGETHKSRGVHLSGATTAGNSFDLSTSAVSGKNDTANNYNWKLERGCVSGKGINGEWRYGPAEDSALRTASAWNDTIDVVQANSGAWGQGGGGGPTSGLVSGTNVVKVPDFEGEPNGQYWSACISGDVKVAYGDYFNETDFNERSVYSLSAIGADIGNKLNKNTIENSKTLRNINNRPYEVYDLAYKRTNFTNGSARRIELDDDANISYNADDVVEESKLYSATIIAETTATGSIESRYDLWKIIDFSNGSAILTAAYPTGIRDDDIDLFTWGGWGPITNCEAICTVYTSAELAPLAFKDDIPSGGGNPEVENYVTTNSGNIDETVSNVITNSGAWGGSALPISAGEGINIQLVNNVLVISTASNV